MSTEERVKLSAAVQEKFDAFDPKGFDAQLAMHVAAEWIDDLAALNNGQGAWRALTDRLRELAGPDFATPSPETGTAAVPTCNCRGTLPLDKGTHTGECCVTPNDTRTAAVPPRFDGEDYLRAMPGGHAMAAGPAPEPVKPLDDEDPPRQLFELLQEVAPTGTRAGTGFVTRTTGCGFEAITSPVYPPYPKGVALRDARVASNTSLGDLARRLELRPQDVSGLENGRLTFDDDATWEKVIATCGASTPAAETAPKGARGASR